MTNHTRVLLLSLLCAFVSGPTRAGDAPKPADVFLAGKEGYHTFRIPSLLVTGKGTLLAFCEGRKTSDSDLGDIDLVGKRSTDGGKTWGPLQLIHEEGGDAKIIIGNPCPVVDADTGTIWLFCVRNTKDVLVTTSDDDGKTWSRAKEVVSLRKPNWKWNVTGPGIGIQMKRGPHKGRLVIPCDHRLAGESRSYSHVFYSDDHGKTWELGGDVAPHMNECQVVERSDGTLLINMRNHLGRDGVDATKAGVRGIAVSKDGGKTWGALGFDKTLVESVCQASILRYSWNEADKSRLLFCNPVHPKRRRELTVRLSYDDGATWPIAKALTTFEDRYAGYSCLAVLPDRNIGCLYERLQNNWQSVGIAFTPFSLGWLTGGRDK